MSRPMPPRGTEFRRRVRNALDLAAAGEIIRANATQGSVTNAQLTIARLEAMYEMAYLRIFVWWEGFQEETFLRTLCGYDTKGAGPVLKVAAATNLAAARIAMLAGAQYVLWHNP